MKILLLTILYLICIVSFAQNNLWYLTRGLGTDEVAWAVDTDNEGNIYWAVEEKDAWPFWYYNIFLYKIDSDGQQLWENPPWGGEFNDIAFKATADGSLVYLSGRKDSSGVPVSGDAFVACYNTSDGAFNWLYHYEPVPDYGYEEIDGLIVKPDGIYIAGWLQSQNSNNEDFLIQKIDLSGQLIWSNSWDYDSLGRFDGANGHMAMDDHFLYIAGHVNRTNIGSLDGQGALACFSRSDGAYQWHTTWGGALYDDALGLTMSSDSMLYMVGMTGSFGNGSQCYLNKYDRSGQLLWSRIWGGSGTEDCRALVADGDSLIFVAGATSSYGNGAKDIFILKYDTTGGLLDSLFWGGTWDETAHDLAMHGDFLYITGETKSFGNGLINNDHKTDGLLLKINGRTMHAPDSSMTGIQPEYNAVENAAVRPNPFDRMATIETNIVLNGAKLTISDISGKKLKSRIVYGKTITLDRENLCKGIYIFEIKQNNYFSAGKFIVSD